MIADAGEDVGKGHTYSLLVQTCAGTTEISVEASQKAEKDLPKTQQTTLMEISEGLYIFLLAHPCSLLLCSQ